MVPLSGFWRTGDGWVRTHGNYPHHADRLTELLGLHPSSSKEEVSAAIATRGALELEDAAAEAGAIVGAVRTPEEWAAHPHAAAVDSSPLVAVRRHT